MWKDEKGCTACFSFLFNLEEPFFLTAAPKSYVAINCFVLANFYQIMKKKIFQDGKHFIFFGFKKKFKSPDSLSPKLH
jgi:hypothetical protein